MTAEIGRGDAAPAGRSRVFAHLNQNAGGILYGVVLAAAATAIVSVRPAKTSYVVGSTLLMLVVYSLAHLYATILGARLARPDEPLRKRVSSQAGYEAAVLEGGFPVLLCFVALRVGGLGVAAAAQAASWFTVALLAYIGYRTGRLLHGPGIRAALETLAAAGIGLLIIVLKTLLY